MSLELKLSAPLPASLQEETWETLSGFLEEQLGEILRDVHEGVDEFGDFLSAELHPAAEPIMIAWNESELRFAAKTATVGPGYHQFLCELADSMAAEWSFAWELLTDSEAAYFSHRDRSALEHDMEQRLAKACAALLERERAPGQGGQIGMPLDVIYEGHSDVLTPLGPRTWDWVARVAEHPASGHDFFAWWNPGQDADYYLRRALCAMWNEVRWRPVSIDTEQRVLLEVVDCLNRAYELDPQADYPYNEWNEILGYLESEEEAPSALSNNPPIGYRRGWVREALTAGWEISLPGSIDGGWEEGTWEGVDGDLSIQFTSFVRQGPDAEQWTEESLRGMRLRGDEDWEYSADGLSGKACLFEDEDDEGDFWQLDARMARTGKLAVLKITFVDPDRKEDALRIWRSLWVKE